MNSQAKTRTPRDSHAMSLEALEVAPTPTHRHRSSALTIADVMVALQRLQVGKLMRVRDAFIQLDGDGFLVRVKGMPDIACEDAATAAREAIAANYGTTTRRSRVDEGKVVKLTEKMKLPSRSLGELELAKARIEARGITSVLEALRLAAIDAELARR